VFQKKFTDVSYHAPIVTANFMELSLSSDYHVFSYIRSSLEFTEPEDSLPSSQQTVTGLSHKLDKSSSHNPILFPLNHSICFFQIWIPFLWLNSPMRTQALLLLRFLDHTQDTTPSVGLHWTCGKPDAGTTTWQHTTLITDRYPCPQRDSNPQSQQVSARKTTP
jgi:hypothetical protein